MKLTNTKTSGSLLFILIISISSTSCANDKDNASDAKIKTISTATAETVEDTMSHGEEAHKNHCYKCHTDDIYTRDNRFVKSIDALSEQVVRCKDGSNVPWFDEDSDAVVQFLNKKYYKF